MAKKVFLKTFGEKVRQARIANRESTYQTAKRVGVPQSTISRYENGNAGIPKPGILRKLSQSYQIDYLDLILSVIGDEYALTAEELGSLSAHSNLKRIERERRKLDSEVTRIEKVIGKIRPQS